MSWSFAVDNAALQFLAEGQTLTQTYTVTVADNNGGSVDQLVTITVTGNQDAPTITAAVDTGAVEEDTLPTSASGTIDFADVDLTDTHTVSADPGRRRLSRHLHADRSPMLRPATAPARCRGASRSTMPPCSSWPRARP